MIPQTTTGRSASLIDALTDQLATPPPEDYEQRWQAQSLAKGAAGVALLHIELAHAGLGTWATAHDWVRESTRCEISVADNAGLYVGAPAIAFVLHAAEVDEIPRYAAALTILDDHVTRLAHRRVDAALARIDRGEMPAFAEYDVLYGLTGIGQLLLQRAPRSDALGRILRYMVRLAEPLCIDGTRFPGWWAFHDPDPILPTPGGHANFGIAHGITGPLALLAQAMRRGIIVEGHIDSISEICTHLDAWRQDGESGPWWPQWITQEELRAGRVRQTGPLRPSWCYGIPGIARAQQIAAIATGDTARQARAEHILGTCLSDPSQLRQIIDTGLCHGWAGLYQTAWRAAHDALTPTISTRLPQLGQPISPARRRRRTPRRGTAGRSRWRHPRAAHRHAHHASDLRMGLMPADQLNPSTATRAHHAQTTAVTPHEMAEGVLAVLAGSSLDQVAAGLGMATVDLADAIETYQRAGHVALETQTATHAWYQVHVQFPEWAAAEKTAATSLGPQLQHLQDTGVIAAWWFIRKAPCWRLRMKLGHDIERAEMKTSANSILDGLTTTGLISCWRQTLYEPETVAFGGRLGMDIAHDLFCSDSINFLPYLCQPDPTMGRRELSVLLCSVLFRAAEQEGFECGDIWHRVARLRPIPAGTPTDRLTELAESLRTLLAYEAHPTGALFGTDGPLAFAASWAAAFDHAGQALAAAANEGALERGTRDVLAHHVIFHWNRIGLPYKTQSILAHAAKTAIFS